MISNRKRPQLIRIQKDSPFYRMSYNGYISPARLAIAKHLDRCIGSDEYIYFEDGDSFNASVDNLRLVSHKELTKLNLIRRVSTQLEQLTAYKKILEQQLDDITFRHTPCNCPKCRRSIESRQQDYNL